MEEGNKVSMSKSVLFIHQSLKYQERQLRILMSEHSSTLKVQASISVFKPQIS